MKTIWKFPLLVTDNQLIAMPKGALLLSVQVQRDRPCLWAPRMVAGIIVLGLFVLAFYTNAFNKLAGSIRPAPPGTAIFMECDMTSLPLIVPSGGTVPVIPLNKKQAQSQHWGFFNVFGEAKTGTWPAKDIMDKSAKLNNPGVFGYKCTVSNHGPNNLIFVGVPIDLNFANDKAAIRYTPIISALDSGNAFVFYIFNDCNTQVSAIWQETARVQVVGESQQRDVPLRRTYRSPIDQIMIFFPTMIRFANQYPVCD